MIGGVEEDAGERVVVGLRNGIVLMIVAARAGDGKTEEAAGNYVDAIVAFVGAGYFDGAVVVIPGAEAEETGCRQCLIARLFDPGGRLRAEL